MTLVLRLALWSLPRLMLGLALWRRLTGRETARDLAERCGQALPPGAVWVHGASNGELASARWVIEALARSHPVHVTASTVTGRALVQSWEIARVTASLAPLDLPRALRRFGRPMAFVNIEGEFWPARFRAMAGLPIILIGARMSERSARIWRRLDADFAAHVTLASAQDAASQARLTGLGIGQWLPPCDLKAEAMTRLPPVTPPDRAARADILLAASTHEGEEAPILDAFAASGFRLLILAPRHPRRGDEIARAITARGLAFGRRSRGDPIPTAPGSVYLADTMGEMERWYAMAGVCFVGGSLVDHGGHTPWEPLRHDCAILHGPHVGNFTAAYGALDARGGALLWQDDVLRGLDGAAQERLVQHARSLGGSQDGDRLMAAVLTLIAAK